MKPRVMLLSPGCPSFVETDFRLLGQLAPTEFINVLDLKFKNLKKYLKALWSTQIFVFWFGSFRHYPFLIPAKLLGRRVVLIAGGYDVERMDEISYGAFTGGFVSRLLRRVLFQLADMVFAVSDHTFKNVIKNAKVDPRRVKKISLAFSPSTEVKLKAWEQRQRQVVMLISSNFDRFLCKGLDRVNTLARRLPQVQFKLAGHLDAESRQQIVSNQAPNLELVGSLPFQGKVFVELLNSSRVVLLPSRCESFGAALMDGALLGCVPVAFAVGALPETLSGIGSVVSQEKLEDMARVIEAILNEKAKDVERVKARVLERFSEQIRSNHIKEALGL